MGQIKVLVAPELLKRLGCDIVVKVGFKADAGNLPANRVQIDSEESNGSDDMLSFMMELADEKEKDGHIRTAETYRTTINRWKDFLKKRNLHTNISWSELTAKLIDEFADYLRQRGTVENTRSFYFRRLRAMCNMARKEDHDVPADLFDDVYTGMAKTTKRALTVRELRKIVRLELDSDNERKARDFFIFSFLTRGMSMIDIANLTRLNISGNKMTYTRKKTGKVLSMEWTEDMQKIVNRYHKSGSKFLLPIMEHDGEEGRDEYRRTQNSINYYLKRVGRKIKLRIPLTMYVARHSWATVAKTINVPTAIISDAMGHSSERTTQIYLDSIDTGRIDLVNRKITGKIFGKL